MNTPKSLVERFYYEVWNQANEEVAREILADEFCLRRSLGAERRGYAAFIQYLRSIHTALADYHCSIEELITSDSHAAVQLTFSARHQGTFLDVEATGRQLVWSGAAFFTLKDGLIADLWVLADFDSVIRQLNDQSPRPFG